jgi:hypothetical protein
VAKSKNGCTATTKCPGMKAALDGSGERQIGFHNTLLLDFKSGETSSAIAYRFPKKVEGVGVILVNFCPWCGEKAVRDA